MMTSTPTRWMFGVCSRIMTPPTIAMTTYMMLPMLPRAGISTLPYTLAFCEESKSFWLYSTNSSLASCS